MQPKHPRENALWGLLGAICLTLAACGHQVTPNPTIANSDLAGDIVVKFRTSAALDFQNVTYVIAMDLCGSGVPYPNAFLTGYGSFSYAFLIGGGFANTAQPLLYQYYLNSGTSGLTKIPINDLNPSTTQFVTPYQGQSNEFEFIFRRSDLNNPFNVLQACPNATAAPSASPIPSATATALVTPTPTSSLSTMVSPGPSASANTTPTASPSPIPTETSGDDSTGVSSPPYLTTWTFNLMTFTSGAATALDSLGSGGPTDNTFSGIVVDTTGTNPYVAYPPPGKIPPQNLAAQITYGEVDTYQL